MRFYSRYEDQEALRNKLRDAAYDRMPKDPTTADLIALGRALKALGYGARRSPNASKQLDLTF